LIAESRAVVGPQEVLDPRKSGMPRYSENQKGSAMQMFGRGSLKRAAIGKFGRNS
jgi:hypothetical protein